ncbi:hypothetical protein ACHHYP_20723 [Achlya hypogyna]|uniref:RRM domain-containing protein n=1 Tax=Achlya hypogyna TaxID=1202772 RepID=A0A1V9YDF2_ACHHY|nr:hypothetical protein ACHHYP_20723 [Achlya hypogyna]
MGRSVSRSRSPRSRSRSRGRRHRGRDRSRSRSRDRGRRRDDDRRSSRSAPQPTSLLVRGITPNTTCDEIRKAFTRHDGDIRDVYIPKDHVTGAPRGFAFIEFSDIRDAREIKREMDRTMFNGTEIASKSVLLHVVGVAVVIAVIVARLPSKPQRQWEPQSCEAQAFLRINESVRRSLY